MRSKTPQAFVSIGLALSLVALEPVTVMASVQPQAAPPPAEQPLQTPPTKTDTKTPQAKTEDNTSETKASETKTPQTKPSSGETPTATRDGKSPVAQDGAAAGPQGEASVPSGQPPTPTTVKAALEVGDLTTARTLAVDHRRHHPDDPKAWRTEAQVHTRLGDYQSAIAAWQGSLKALPEDADAERREAEAAITELRLRARGAVAGEPESTHRADFDQKRAATAERAPSKTEPKGAAAATPAPQERDRIATKWYFWVTLLAIAASAGAVTGIAIRAATRDEDDAVSIGSVDTRGPALFRF